MKLLCTKDHTEPYMPSWTTDTRSKIEWYLKSSAAVQVNFDAASMNDYPILVDNLVNLFNELNPSPPSELER